jgi:hypothetical protein
VDVHDCRQGRALGEAELDKRCRPRGRSPVWTELRSHYCEVALGDDSE